MIPEIGILVALYIVLRVAEVLAPSGERKAPPVIAILAVLTGLVALAVIADLAVRGVSGTATILPAVGPTPFPFATPKTR